MHTDPLQSAARAGHTALTLALVVALAVPARAQLVIVPERVFPADGSFGDLFGESVAVSGGLAVVGSPLNDAGASNSGAVYVVDVASTTILRKLAAGDPRVNASLGKSVALDGTTLLVGANEDPELGFRAGSAYLFDAATGDELFKLLPDDGAANDRFGGTVALDGTFAIVGAWGNDGSGLDAGAVYVFDTVTGTQLRKLTPGDAGVGDFFGISVALDGTTALIGATGDDDGAPDAGAVYLFDVTTGVQLAKWHASDAMTGANFGFAVALSASRALIGAHEESTVADDAGAAYLFDAASGAELHRFEASDGGADHEFGRSVSLRGGVALVGAPEHDRAYLFDAVSGATITALVPDTDSFSVGHFGRSVALGDGCAVVGAFTDDSQGSSTGSAFVHRDTPSAGFRNAGTNPDSFRAGAAWLGGTLPFTVDLTTTGHSSALVIGFDSPVALPLGQGQTLLCLDLFGNGELLNTGFHTGPFVSIDLPVPPLLDLLGLRLCTQAIHAFGVTPFALSNAQDLVVGGCPAGPGTWTTKLLANVPQPGELFGSAIAIAGDTAVIGAPGAVAGVHPGAAHVVDVASGTDVFLLQASDGSPGDGFARALAIDGLHVLVGAPYQSTLGSGAGAAYLFDATTGVESLELTASDGGASDNFGHAVAVSGARALIGAPRDDDVASNAGAAYLFDLDTGAELAKFVASDGSASDFFGISVALAGSIAVVGAPLDDDAGAVSGAAYVIDVTTGAELFKLVPMDAAAGWAFGNSVALDGTTALIGALDGSGLAVAYLFDVTTGTEIARVDSEGFAEVEFLLIPRVSAALGDGLAVLGEGGVGSLKVFDATTGAMLETHQVGCDEAQVGRFASTVAIGGGRVLAGAPDDDTAGRNAGSAFVFE